MDQLLRIEPDEGFVGLTCNTQWPGRACCRDWELNNLGAVKRHLESCNAEAHALIGASTPVGEWRLLRWRCTVRRHYHIDCTIALENRFVVRRESEATKASEDRATDKGLMPECNQSRSN